MISVKEILEEIELLLSRYENNKKVILNINWFLRQLLRCNRLGEDNYRRAILTSLVNDFLSPLYYSEIVSIIDIGRKAFIESILGNSEEHKIIVHRLLVALKLYLLKGTGCLIVEL